MIVCLCHRVSDHAIAREARSGCASFEALQDSLRVATACGACADCAREVFVQALQTPGLPACIPIRPSQAAHAAL